MESVRSYVQSGDQHVVSNLDGHLQPIKRIWMQYFQDQEDTVIFRGVESQPYKEDAREVLLPVVDPLCQLCSCPSRTFLSRQE